MGIFLAGPLAGAGLGRRHCVWTACAWNNLFLKPVLCAKLKVINCPVLVSGGMHYTALTAMLAAVGVEKGAGAPLPKVLKKENELE